MGLGREVADAYIEVHGDLSKFRKDLEGAKGKMEELAKKNAKSFTDAWDAQAANDFKRKWADTVQAMYSGEKLDFNRLIKSFDPTDLDAAEQKVKDFLANMSRRQKLTGENYKATKKALLDTIEAMRLEEKQAAAILQVEKELGEMREKQNRALAERASIMEEAIKDNERWARTFEGMRKNDAIKNLNEDFRKLASIMDHTDVSKFAKGFENFDQMRDRVNDVTDAMIKQKRISEDSARELRRNVETFILLEEQLAQLKRENAEKDKQAKADALAEAKRLREEQERYKKSLDGMLEAATFSKLETDMRSLTQAIASSDWSQISRGSTSMQEFRDKVIAVGFQLKATGRISEEEFGKIIENLDKASANADEFNVKLDQLKDGPKEATRETDLFSAALHRAGAAALGLSQKVGAMSGFGVVTDMFRSGREFMQNFDRNTIALSKSVTLAGTLVSTVGAAVGGMVVLGQDLAKMSAIGLLAPAFLTGAGIGIGVLVASFKDMKTRLKDLGPAFSALQDNISAAFWKQAETPIRNMVKSLLPTLDKQLRITGTRMGDIFAEFAKAVQREATADKVGKMFDRMHGALDRIKDAVSPLVSAFVTLGDTGSKYFGRAADAIVGMAEDFDRFIQKAANNGDLDRWIEDAIQGFKDVGSIIGSTTGIFDSIGDAAKKAGIGGLTEFADALKRADEVMKGDRFQGGMTLLFEGMKAGVDAVIDSIKKIGPNIEAALPTISGALGTIGEIAGKVIEHAGAILSNPKFLSGVTTFVDGIKDAVGRLTPAMGPIGDSLGGLMSLMGRLLPPIADLISYVTVNLGPIFDKMLGALEPLVQPTTDFVKEIVKLTTPALKTFAETTLPGIVNFVKQLFTPMKNIATVLTPAFATTLNDIGRGFHNAGEGLKLLNGQANEFKWPNFSSGLPEPKKMQETWGKASGKTFWEDLGDVLFGGDLLGMGQRMMNAWADDFTGLFKGLGDLIVDGWNKVWSGQAISSESQQNIAKFWEDDQRQFEEITEKFKTDMDLTFQEVGRWWDETVGSWLNDIFSGEHETTVNPGEDFFAGIIENLGTAWEDATTQLTDWYENTLKPWFQDFMKSILGFGGDGAEEGTITGGGVGTMSKGGKITPEMLGLGAPEEGWLQETFNSVTESVGTFFTDIGTNIALFGETVRTNWNAFWDGLGTKVTEIWTGMTTWISTKAGEIGTNIGAFTETVRTNWTAFWDGVGRKVNEIWTGITSWVSTKAGEIRTNIDGFITTVRTNWDNFWTTVRNKVTETWNGVTSWIGSKTGEIRGNIDGFINTVRTNWNNFWTTVRSKVTETWSTIRSWISGKVGEIRGNIDSFINGVKSNWQNGWNAVKTTVTQAWENIKTAVSNAGNNVVEFVRGLPGKISAALGGLGGLLTGAGNAIMDGLRNGISAGFEAVKSVVGGIAGWIRDNKGPISYDRVLLIPAGKAIMDGLEQGLLSRMAPLADTLHSITALLSDTVTDGFARSKMYLAGAEAALGLADGLKSRSGALQGALGELTPVAGLSISGTGGVGVPTPGVTKIINIEAGAIPVSTPAEDPRLVASMTIDAFAAEISNF